MLKFSVSKVMKISLVATMQTTILNRQKDNITMHILINFAGLLTDRSHARSKVAAIFASANDDDDDDLVNLEFENEAVQL